MLASKRADGDLRNGLRSSSVKTRFLRSNLNFIPQFLLLPNTIGSFLGLKRSFWFPIAFPNRHYISLFRKTLEGALPNAVGSFFCLKTRFLAPHCVSKWILRHRAGPSLKPLKQWLEAPKF
jgi:hypothetical protein